MGLVWVPTGRAWAPEPEGPGVEFWCAAYQLGGPGQVPLWAPVTSCAGCEGPACGCTWKGLGYGTPSGRLALAIGAVTTVLISLTCYCL